MMVVWHNEDMRSLTRFVKYTSVGVSTFALDLALLFILTDVFRVHYVLSAGIAFCIAVSLNYVISRRFVFGGTERGMQSGYVMFLLIAAVGLLAVMGLMYISVDRFGLNYIVSRVLIAGLVGFWTYLMNLYWNFRVAGK